MSLQLRRAAHTVHSSLVSIQSDLVEFRPEASIVLWLLHTFYSSLSESSGSLMHNSNSNFNFIKVTALDEVLCKALLNSVTKITSGKL